jgi:cell division protein FtsI (penicillin-binding protein 3)|tara:strand:+ start:2077 stop:3759 length:1683 start_codon:yes stop_codon:yes gene_type:complete
MNDDNKNIIVEEYENEFSYKKRKTNLNIQFNRIAFIFFIFLIISIIYSIQLLHLGSLKMENKEIKTIINNKNYRADIIDRNGNYLVKTVSTINVGIKPKDVIDKKHLLLMLNYIYKNKDISKIEKKINRNKFFYLEKNISSKKYEELMLLGDKSISSEESLIRLYPQENLFSHIIGQIDDDNNGISGIEKSFDRKLKQIKEPLMLTLDTDIQFLIRSELLKFQEIFRAKGSAAILMNVNNGEILSMVSLPDFNLNKRESIKDVNYINRVTKGTYELGSVFKTFTLASGINEELIEPDTEFLDSKKTINCGKNHSIGEYDDEMPSDLTAEQILIKSGNIGSVRIARKIGVEKHKSFLKSIGILGKIDFDIEEVGKPQPIDWYEGCKLETISFGHGITTTILQLAKGYSIITNGGYDIKPTLIKKNLNTKYKGEKILRNDVSKKMNAILRKVVLEGTAKQVNVKGYQVGGKTGTAEQPRDKIYSNIKINTLASIFPAENPKYVLVVMLESPKTSSEYVYKYRHKEGSYKGSPFNTAGWTSVEAAGQIIEKIGPILATKYIEN